MIVTIRPLEENDALISYKWRNDPEVFKYTGRKYNKVIDLECERAWLRKVIKRPNEYRCAIIADNVYVGNIYLTEITSTSAVYQIFIGNKNYWGKGIAKKASKLILDYAFTTLNLERVDLRVRNANESAKCLYLKLGFSVKGCDGEWINMQITKDSFSQLNK